MATDKRLIDAKALKETVTTDYYEHFTRYHDTDQIALIDMVCDDIEEAPTVEAVELPCKIGDFVWAIRNYKGKKHPQRGIVSDMFYMNDMSLQIVVKHVARGKWGETVFATDKEAYEAIGERKDND